ncbi:hypothetical protein V500_06802 [Pseudogymnoascus sp. VKM F-4518 (FW-2643)]|nr:hypothetical protein V500_06802 [Pseudogymnoascus sp. VKM F-4518 (FW-2643)]
MVVDEMEISYDGNEGDDDIDINIDIEPGNHDEDFIIEDARSEAGTNDDVMLDEDNASYNMEDADYVPEEELQDVIDTETIDVSELEMLRPHDTDEHTFPSNAVPSPLQSEDRYTNNKPADDTISFAQAAQAEQLQPEEVSKIVEEVAAQPTPSPTIHKESPPLSNEKPQEVENINPQSPPQVLEEQEQENGEASNVDENEQKVNIEQKLISEERNITVGYQGSEYALVASSESDDPDSYFLKDSSVLKEPLSALFAVLRDILHDEIPAGDELVFTIDDLGLETCETSTSNTEITFSQIVDLHTTLVRNDGENTLPSLYVTLGTKSEFGRFFENLAQDARQGKGLQEVAKSWNEDNGLEIWGESEAYDINGIDADESEQVENVELGNEDWTEVGSVQDISPGSPSVEASTEEKPSTAADAVEPDTTQVPGVSEEDVSNEPNEPRSENHDAELTKPEANGNHEEEEDGGDLIDYDDEDYAQGGNEVETAPKQEETDYEQPAPVAEHQATDEVPDKSRRSSSQTIDGTNETDAIAQPSIDAPGDVNGAVDSANDVASTNENIGQEVEVGESFEAGADEHEHQAEVGESFEAGADGHEHQVEVGEGFEAGADEHEHQAEEGESFEAGVDEHEHQDNGEYEGEVPYEDDVDASYYVENEDGHAQETNGEAEHGEESGHINIDTEVTASDTQNNRSAENDDGGEISYEDDDVDGSLSALVENDETGKPAVTDPNQNHKEETDEIDYEDDDEVSLFVGSGPTTPEKSLAAGKRPHEEDEEANGIDGQEAKRPRS